MEHCDVTIVGPDAVARPAHRAVIRYASSGLAHEIHVGTLLRRNLLSLT